MRLFHLITQIDNSGHYIDHGNIAVTDKEFMYTEGCLAGTLRPINMLTNEFCLVFPVAKFNEF